MTYKDIKNNQEVCEFIKKGNANLRVMGFTDHSEVHCTMVAERAAKILRTLEYSQKDIELVMVAGFMHDIGNCINRSRHAEYGALLANEFLEHTDMPISDRVMVVSAIGNHDESTGGAKDAVSAALIIADKTDVRRNRVVDKDYKNFDIHDRVNYAVTDNVLDVDKDKKEIALRLKLDENICTMYEYFDIFLGRMMMCRGAAEMLGVKFKLYANDSKIL